MPGRKQRATEQIRCTNGIDIERLQLQESAQASRRFVVPVIVHELEPDRILRVGKVGGGNQILVNGFVAPTGILQSQAVVVMGTPMRVSVEDLPPQGSGILII